MNKSKVNENKFMKHLYEKYNIHISIECDSGKDYTISIDGTDLKAIASKYYMETTFPDGIYDIIEDLIND